MKVLLFADVGKGSSGFYHVGDEAMLYETYRAYKKNADITEIGILSSAISHQRLDCREFLHLTWPVKPNSARFYYFKLLGKSILYTLTGKSFFSSEQQNFIEIIRAYDRIHFSGGGNITSVFSSWLYYALFIIIISKSLKKEVVLSSQTIGPFNFFDKLVATFTLNLVHSISLRESAKPFKAVFKYLFLFPKVTYAADVASTLPLDTTYHLPPRKEDLRIGLSLHEWPHYSEALKTATSLLLAEIAKHKSVGIVLIPHVLTNSVTTFDMKYMNEFLQKLPKDISVITPTYKDLMYSSQEPATTIKSITSEVDILISSRYHGLVFALSTKTTFIGFLMDEYYNHKNIELLTFHKPYLKGKSYFIDLRKNMQQHNLPLLLKGESLTQ